MKRIKTTLFALLAIQFGFAQQYNILAPETFVSGKAFPFVVEVEDQNELNLFHSEEVNLGMTGTTEAIGLLKIKKGRAMFTSLSNGLNGLSITSSSVNVNPSQNSGSETGHGGTTSGNQTWATNSVHRITSQLTIQSGDTLQIESGCWVLLDSAVNIIVEGHLKVLGSEQNVVVFCSNNSDGWGGIVASSGTVSASYALFNNGGNDASRAYGHSGSQATVKSDGGLVEMNRCFVFDCVGKGLGSQDGQVEFVDGGISRCDMGGEFAASQITVHGSHVLDIPNDDGIFQDDDNDGFYFAGANQASDLSIVDSCVFMFGKDDAIDHNGAVLAVRNCWVEGFEHEGIAASNQNSVSVFNSLFKDCEQGIEAGYGSPMVTVDHCVMVGNDYGLRFGDWYDWGCTGNITCTNSIMIDNASDNVYNFDLQSNGPIADAITLTYSIPTDVDYDGGIGCITGTPVFNNQYQLEPNSPGIGVASDGLNIGLIPPVVTGLSEIENNHAQILSQFNIYSIDGKLVGSGNKKEQIPIFIIELQNGIYLIEEVYASQRLTRKIAVAR